MLSTEAKKIIDLEDYIEPETLKQFDEQISSLEIQKELAKKVIKNTEAPFVDFYVFDKIVHVLNDIEPSEESLDGATPEMVWKALEEIKKIREEFTLSYEVKTYIKFIFKEEGFLFYPPEVDIPNPYFEEIKNRAKHVPIVIDDDDPNPTDLQAIKYLKIKEFLNG